MTKLHIIPTTNPTYGGPIEGLKQTVGVHIAEGFDTHIICMDAPDAPWLADFPYPVIALGPSDKSYAYSRKLLPWLRANADKYDAVVIHGIWQYPGWAARTVLRERGIPYFVYTHGMLDPWFKIAYPFKHIKKSLYWKLREHKVLRDATGVLFTCDEERQLASQTFQPYQCNEVVVNYGTAAPTGDPKEQKEKFLSAFPHLRGKRVFLFLSRIHPKKGCELLLEAFAKVAARDASLHLVIAGPDSVGWQSQLQKQAQQLGIADKVTWAGMLSGDVKWGAYYAADAFTLTSHSENFGVVVAEALACGTPVLISNKVNIWREIEQDGGGLVANDDVPGSIELLEKWLKLPDAARQEMRTNARKCFYRRFEIKQSSLALLRVLCDATGRAGQFKK